MLQERRVGHWFVEFASSRLDRYLTGSKSISKVNGAQTAKGVSTTRLLIDLLIMNFLKLRNLVTASC